MADRPDPVVGPRDVLIRVMANSLNYRDLAIATGSYGGPRPKPDVIPVSDGAGVIVATGVDVTGYAPGDFIHSIGDAHIYRNHMDQVALQLSRAPKPLPHLTIARRVPSLFDFTYKDFQITGYDPDPAIRAPVAV